MLNIYNVDWQYGTSHLEIVGSYSMLQSWMHECSLYLKKCISTVPHVRLFSFNNDYKKLRNLRQKFWDQVSSVHGVYRCRWFFKLLEMVIMWNTCHSWPLLLLLLIHNCYYCCYFLSFLFGLTVICFIYVVKVYKDWDGLLCSRWSSLFDLLCSLMVAAAI